MEHSRIYTIEELNEYRDILDKKLKKVPGYSHFTIKECPNPWGWSPLAELKIFVSGSAYSVHIMYYGGASCLSDDLRKLIQMWLDVIESAEMRTSRRHEILCGDIIGEGLRRSYEASVESGQIPLSFN